VKARAADERAAGRRGAGAPPAEARLWILVGVLLVALVPGLAAGQLPLPGARGGAKSKDDKAQPLTVDADRMERFGKENLVIFSGNVVARRDNSVQYAERVEVYLDEKGDRVLRTVSTGGVRIITKDCRTGTAQRAEYFDLEQRVTLIGNARVWEEDNVVSGDTITLYISQDRSIVQGGKQERVKAVFYAKDTEKQNGGDAAPKRTAEPCKN
jgi:lipopolysaccharide export system protein LptA